MDAISTDTDSTAEIRLEAISTDFAGTLEIRETISTERSPVPVTDLSTSKIEIRLEVIRETTSPVPVTDLSTSECSPVTDLSTRDGNLRCALRLPFPTHRYGWKNALELEIILLSFRYEPTATDSPTSRPSSAPPVPVPIEDQNIDLRLYEYMAGCREPACSLFRILKLGSIDIGKRGDLAAKSLAMHLTRGIGR